MNLQYHADNPEKGKAGFDDQEPDVRSLGNNSAPNGEKSDAYVAPLHRNLKSRHIQMIAIGGIIGPGLLVGSGNALHLAGPAGILISFSLVGIIVFFVMQSIGELATLIPVSGSFTEYAERFVDPALAFALGWAYWYLWCTVLANEYNALAVVITYWSDTVPNWAWILIFWFLFLALSMLGVLTFGEVEFWLASIKVLGILAFFITAIFISAGVVGPQKIGFKYWDNPGSFADGINGVARTFVIAGTLYAGTEMQVNPFSSLLRATSDECDRIGITAGEAGDPRHAVPRAIKQVFWRILVFYVGMMFFIGILIPYDSPRLLSTGSRTAASPLTIALSEAGITAAASVINALIVVSVISAGNSSLYISSRTIVYLARNGKAPKFFGITNKWGVPWVALLFSNGFACIAFISQSSSAGTLYNALISLSGVATFIVWATIQVVHIRFRAALKAQGERWEDLPFKSLWYPYSAWATLAANIFLIFFQGYTAFLTPFSAQDFVVNYILIPVFALFFIVWKVWHKTKFVKLLEMDIQSGRREFDATLDELYGKRPTLWRKIKHVVVG